MTAIRSKVLVMRHIIMIEKLSENEKKGQRMNPRRNYNLIKNSRLIPQPATLITVALAVSECYSM